MRIVNTIILNNYRLVSFIISCSKTINSTYFCDSVIVQICFIFKTAQCEGLCWRNIIQEWQIFIYSTLIGVTTVWWQNKCISCPWLTWVSEVIRLVCIWWSGYWSHFARLNEYLNIKSNPIICIVIHLDFKCIKDSLHSKLNVFCCNRESVHWSWCYTIVV